MEYQKINHQSLMAADTCRLFTQAYRFDESTNIIAKIQKEMEDNKLVVMAIGEARTGKSSLLGAYLGDEDLFPVDVDVTTCLVTLVKYAQQERVTVVLVDEQGQECEQTITRKQISDYAKEQNNRHGEKRAKMVLIETPNERLKDGLVIVDSPGIGSMNPMHSRLTYQFLPRADAVLFISDATSQISESELDFLKSVHRSCENILFVLTKADLQEDCTALIEQNKKHIEKYIGVPGEEQIHIPVSSRMLRAYRKSKDAWDLEESNFTQFHNQLWAFLSERRPRITLLPKLLELQEEMQKLDRGITVRETAYSQDENKIQQLQRTLEAQEKRKQELLDRESDWKEEIRRSVKALEEQLNDKINSYINEAKDEIAVAMTKNAKKNPKTIEAKIIGITVQTEQEMVQMVGDKVDDIRKGFLDRSGMSLASVDAKLDMTHESQIDFKKRKVGASLSAGNKKYRETRFVAKAIGGVAGGIVGGTVGFFSGGIVGAIVGASQGAGWGAYAGDWVGKGVGAMRGVMEGVNAYDPAETQRALEQYVTQTAEQWRRNKGKYGSALTDELIASCREIVREDVNVIQKDLAQVSQAKSTLGAQQRQIAAEIAEERAAFNRANGDLEQAIGSIVGEARMEEYEYVSN